METVKLPQPELKEDVGITSLQRSRESRRRFRDEKLSLEEISYILWSAGGSLPGFPGRKVPPSAGARYPIDVFLSVRENGLDGVEPGVYEYALSSNTLEPLAEGDRTGKIVEAALSQKFIAEAPVTVVLAADFYRTTVHYGERGNRYVYMDAGHAAQNVYLAVEAVGLGTCAIGAFRDDDLTEALGLKKELKPVYLYPVGRRVE